VAQPLQYTLKKEVEIFYAPPLSFERPFRLDREPVPIPTRLGLFRHAAKRRCFARRYGCIDEKKQHDASKQGCFCEWSLPFCSNYFVLQTDGSIWKLPVGQHTRSAYKLRVSQSTTVSDEIDGGGYFKQWIISRHARNMWEMLARSSSNITCSSTGSARRSISIVLATALDLSVLVNVALLSVIVVLTDVVYSGGQILSILLRAMLGIILRLIVVPF